MVLHGLAYSLCSIRVRGNRCDHAADLELVWLLRVFSTGLAVSV